MCGVVAHRRTNPIRAITHDQECSVVLRLSNWRRGALMKKIDVSDPAWRLLGELELTFSGGAEASVSTRLEEILAPLDLPAEFRKRIFNSAQEAIARIIQSHSAIVEVDHIYLLILTPPDHSAK